MAIKINGQDLLKRYINGQEIVRVYKNGGQIRPETVPPVSPLLCFTAEESNSTIRLQYIAQAGSPTPHSLETSRDGVSWTDYSWTKHLTNYTGDTITLANIGDKVYWRSKVDSSYFSGETAHYTFEMTGKIGASGDVNYLITKQSTKRVGRDTFGSLFAGCVSLTTPPQLPATILGDGCYSYMFGGCTSLTTAPSLPALSLAPYCYAGMFNECTSLITAPQLPSTNLANYCYRNMFMGCTSLVNAPQLPATSLKTLCYGYMFDECTSLVNAPKLPATDLADRCYQHMFSDCTSLSTLPELPATTLKDTCYFGMFSDCPLIKISEPQTGEYQTPYRIPSSGTGTNGNNSMTSMFYGTGGTFTNDPSINTTYYTSNQVI